MNTNAWISGPKEILEHALILMAEDTAPGYRLAFISIDNSVELLLKTYINLPKRITKFKGTSKALDDHTAFPELIKIIVEEAPEKLENINLNDIEWYHSLRNQLYHQGNGLSIEKDKVICYLEIARKLLLQLYDFEFTFEPIPDHKKLIEYVDAWHKFQNAIVELYISEEINAVFSTTEEALSFFRKIAGINELPDMYDAAYELDQLYELWINVTNGQVDYRKLITDDVMRKIQYYQDWAHGLIDMFEEDQ